MKNDRQREILLKLTAEGEKAQTRLDFDLRDDAVHLSDERRTAWSQLLSSAASAESSEEMIIKPVLSAFDSDPLLKNYLATHRDDEDRHQKYLKTYVKNSFSYVRKKKSIASLVVYDGVFNLVAKVADKRPLPVLIAILFYEWFAEEFYSDMMKRAEEDKLHNLKNLFAAIEKDEHRHRAGIKAVINIWKSEGRRIDQVDILFTKILLGITRMDVNTAEWAFYNKRLRTNFINIGINPDDLYQRSKSYAQKAIAELEVQAGRAS